MGVHVQFDPEGSMPPGLAKRIRAYLEQRYAAVSGTVEVYLDYEPSGRFRIVTAQHFDPGRLSAEGKTDPMHNESYVARVRARLERLRRQRADIEGGAGPGSHKRSSSRSM